MNEDIKYILLTAARNEELYIEMTINSVISQTKKPLKWIIVSNNSTDSTEKIVRNYLINHSFIELISINSDQLRNFASKVSAINEGIRALKDYHYDYIGILDADISLPEDYYQRVIEELIINPKVGIAGGDLHDVIGGKIYQMPKSAYSVRGGIQLFRKECFDSIGGLQPLRLGGEDTLAEIKARYFGWDTYILRDLTPLHHRRTGTGTTSLLKSFFRMGIIEYSLGYHPLFQFLKCLRRTIYKPLLLGSIFRLSGFWWAFLKRMNKNMPDEIIQFLHKEQVNRIKKEAMQRFLFRKSINDDSEKLNHKVKSLI